MDFPPERRRAGLGEKNGESVKDSPITEATEAMSIGWTAAAAVSVARPTAVNNREAGLEEGPSPCSLSAARSKFPLHQANIGLDGDPNLAQGDGPYALAVRRPGWPFSRLGLLDGSGSALTGECGHTRARRNRSPVR